MLRPTQLTIATDHQSPLVSGLASPGSTTSSPVVTGGHMPPFSLAADASASLSSPKKRSGASATDSVTATSGSTGSAVVVSFAAHDEEGPAEASALIVPPPLAGRAARRRSVTLPPPSPPGESISGAGSARSRISLSGGVAAAAAAAGSAAAAAPGGALSRSGSALELCDFGSRAGSPFDSAASLRHTLRHDTEHTFVEEADEDFAGYETVNGYSFVQLVGHGAQGEVWRVIDDAGQEFAMKILKKKRLLPKVASLAALNAGRSGTSADGAGLATGGGSVSAPPTQKLEREVAVMKKLSHRHIVPLYEVIDDDANQRLLLRMKWVANGPLTDFDRARGATTKKLASEAVLRKHLRQTLCGLAYLHARGIIHRDIKPQNILIDENDDAYLADFGLSEHSLSGDFRTFPHEGTPAFQAPELVRAGADDAVDGRACDVWALGVTFFSVIAGYHPFAAGGCGVAETRRRILEHDEVVFPPTAEASAECRDIVLRMLEKDPARRATVAALRQHPFLGRRTKLRAERIVRETQITDAALEKLPTSMAEIDPVDGDASTILVVPAIASQVVTRKPSHDAAAMRDAKATSVETGRPDPGTPVTVADAHSSPATVPGDSMLLAALSDDFSVNFTPPRAAKLTDGDSSMDGSAGAAHPDDDDDDVLISPTSAARLLSPSPEDRSLALTVAREVVTLTLPALPPIEDEAA